VIFARFISFQIMVMALDALVTWLLVSKAGIPILLGKTIGTLSAAAFAVVYLRQVSVFANNSRFIAVSITLISLLVNYGMFTLLVLRNPILQWPLACGAATTAALLLSGIGYWRVHRFTP